MYTIGIDIGTTGTKTYVLDGKGAVCGQGYQAYGLDFRSGGYVGQNPEDWWNACVVSVRQAISGIRDKEVICAMALSTQGGSSFIADAYGRPLMDAMTWMDARALDQIKGLQETFSDEFFYNKTGWKLNVSMDVTKYLWLRQHKKELIKKGNCFVSTLEFINRKLVGTYVIDPTNAAMRQLINVRTLEWDEEILDYLEIDVGFLPEIAPSGGYLGTLSRQAAEELGLPAHVRVYNGMHDQYSAAIGAGAVHKGDLMLSTGTAWVVLGVTNSLMFTNSFIAAGRHALDGLYGALATLPVAGVALDWFKKGFGIDSYEQINELCRDKKANARNLFFYPYFNGATFPLWQYDAKAAMVGLSLEHDRFDVAYALMEGVVFQMKMMLDDYKRNGFEGDRISVMGGALKSELWMSLIASITGCRVNKVKITDTACIGAALVAGVAGGIYGSYESILAEISPLEAEDVRGESLEYYAEKYDAYQRNWDSLSLVYEGNAVRK